MRKKPVKRVRVLVIVHEDLIPPAEASRETKPGTPWEAEYDVISGLEELGHEIRVVGIRDQLGAIRSAVHEFKPDIVFNLMEEFDGVALFDQNIVSYLELLKLPYTGCNPRGLMLARDKSLAKKIFSYHGILTPAFEVYPKGLPIQRSQGLQYPVIVKSVSEEASLGISQSSIVSNWAQLEERIHFVQGKLGTDVLVEEFIDGRELYVGSMGNLKIETFPVWELFFNDSHTGPKIATRRAKWDENYRKRHGIYSAPAKDLPPSLLEHTLKTAKKAFKVLSLNGYARLDLRLSNDGKLYVLEANPNPHIGRDEDFAKSAEVVGWNYPSLLNKLITLGLRWRPLGTL